MPVTPTDEPVWSLPGAFGLECWHRGPDRFTAVEAGLDRIALPCDPVTADRLQVRQSVCVHPGPFPQSFRFCPDCGQALPEGAGRSTSRPWSPPFGAADGLPEIAEAGAPDPASQQELPVPASPALGFAVAGTPPMLFACDRPSGWISAWSETAGGWVERVQVAASAALPSWSWSAVADRAGLTLPTDRGAVWLGLTAPRTIPVRAHPDAIPLGGAASLRGRVVVPALNGGRLALLLLEPPTAIGGMPGWATNDRITVEGDPGEIPTGPLAAPAVVGGQASWCGAEGLLLVHATADGMTAHWHRWPDGLRPLPGMRPVLAPNGTLHQPSRLGPDALVLEGIGVMDQHPAPGYAPGTGRAVFREAARLRLPWDERIAAEYPLPDKHFLLPLLSCGEDRYVLAVCSHRDGLGGFLGDPASEAGEIVHDCTLVYSRGPRMLEPLGCLLRARAAWELSVVVHDNWLYVHGALENRLHRWRLRDAA